MSLMINTWRDPYDCGFSLTKPKQIELKEGFTVLVGCNGAGKTTLILNIEEQMKSEKIPCHKFDNLKDGGSSSILGSILGGFKEYECDTLGFGATMLSSSEGEALKMHIGRQSTLYRSFLETGHYLDRSRRFANIFSDEEEKEITDNKRVLLFDATDSGMSIDAVCEIKMLFQTVLEDAKKLGKELYIIISANEYELARGEECFDVNEGKYLNFTDYEDYRTFIMKSRQKKEKRIEKQILFREKKKESEKNRYLKKRKELLQKKESVFAKYDKGIELKNMNSRDRWKIEDINRDLNRMKYDTEYLSKEECEELDNMIGESPHECKTQ